MKNLLVVFTVLMLASLASAYVSVGTNVQTGANVVYDHQLTVSCSDSQPYPPNVLQTPTDMTDTLTVSQSAVEYCWMQAKKFSESYTSRNISAHNPSGTTIPFSWNSDGLIYDSRGQCCCNTTQESVCTSEISYYLTPYASTTTMSIPAYVGNYTNPTNSNSRPCMNYCLNLDFWNCMVCPFKTSWGDG